MVSLRERGLPAGEFRVSMDITAVESRILGKAAGVIRHGSKYGGDVSCPHDDRWAAFPHEEISSEEFEAVWRAARNSLEEN